MADHPTDSSDAPESVEAAGVSVEDALRQALRQLNATIDDVDVEILSSGGSRLLRRDAEARVRVVRRERPFSATIDETEHEPPVEPESSAEPEPEPPARAAEPIEAPADPPPADPPAPEPVEEPVAEQPATRPRASRSLVESGEELQDIVEDLLVGMLDRMGFIAEIELVDEDPLAYNVVGDDDFSKLIGRHGSTLRSFGYLINLMAGRQLGQPCRVLIDVNSYRARRADHLRELAETLADQVDETQEPVTLESMPANERRLIHVALADDENVRTYSIGEGDERRVVISPKA
ncbi:MAG: Jag N-terminal domain-containing protein [Chloroflexi bacterium]|nr:Jag N-terminal domain-containing protein [Chloroflexota bacterium]